jgi:hypothetical protein
MLERFAGDGERERWLSEDKRDDGVNASERERTRPAIA